MISTSPVMDELSLVEKSETKITFKWTPLFHEEKVSYLVLWDSGTNGEFKKLARTDQSIFTITVSKTGKFKFAVKADTQCGIGPLSPILVVEKSNVPSPV